MYKKIKDFNCLLVARYLNTCNNYYEASLHYEEQFPQNKGRWWFDKMGDIAPGQKIHMITYLGSCQKLKGQNKNSMYHVWSENGFKNAAGLIWLLEALDADKQIIQKAVNAGKTVGENFPTNQPKQSSAIKEAVPWETVAALLEANGIPSSQRKSR